MDNKKNGIPKLRFPGFTGAWEQRKFFDNIEKVIDFRGRTPKKLGMEWSAEGYTALSALNVKDGYIDFTADVHYANQDLYDKWMAGNELYKGQVLFTTEAPMGNVAQVPDNRKYVLSQRTIAFNVDKTKVTNDFLAVLLRSQNVQHTLKSLASGGTAQGVSQKSLSQLKVILPINPKEQQEIGNFFNHFDSLIALHQRKLEHLKEQKKGLLQKMFPKNGEVVPEVRFPGFTDDWEQRKLGEFFKKYQNKIFLDDETKYIQISVRNTGKVEYRTTNYGKNIGRKRQYLVDTKHYPDTLTFTRQTIYEGGIGYIPNSLNGAIVTENMPLLAKNSKLDKDFSKILFKTHLYYHNVIEKNKPIGSAQKALHEKVWLDCIVLVPSLHEQQKIGNFFEQLDSLITLHQRKLEHLKLMKKGLLQQMFV